MHAFLQNRTLEVLPKSSQIPITWEYLHALGSLNNKTTDVSVTMLHLLKSKKLNKRNHLHSKQSQC